MARTISEVVACIKQRQDEGWCATCLMREDFDTILEALAIADGALKDILNPIGALQREADATGSRLNDRAYSIANSVSFLQDIARRALSRLEARPVAVPDELRRLIERDAPSPWRDHLIYSDMDHQETARAAVNFVRALLSTPAGGEASQPASDPAASGGRYEPDPELTDAENEGLRLGTHYIAADCSVRPKATPSPLPETAPEAGLVEALTEALKPFADWFDAVKPYFPDNDDRDLVAGDVGTDISFGDLRRARAALSRVTGGQADV